MLSRRFTHPSNSMNSHVIPPNQEIEPCQLSKESIMTVLIAYLCFPPKEDTLLDHTETTSLLVITIVLLKQGSLNIIVSLFLFLSYMLMKSQHKHSFVSSLFSGHYVYESHLCFYIAVVCSIYYYLVFHSISIS